MPSSVRTAQSDRMIATRGGRRAAAAAAIVPAPSGRDGRIERDARLLLRTAGNSSHPEQALAQARKIVAEGADIIDIGGGINPRRRADDTAGDCERDEPR
jgi:hypothetical protein